MVCHLLHIPWMMERRSVLHVSLVLWIVVKAQIVLGDNMKAEVCNEKIFNVTCKEGEVLGITEAWYGRRAGMCVVQLDKPCGCDITKKLQERCGGDKGCQFEVLNKKIGCINSSCSRDYRTHLYITYHCSRTLAAKTEIIIGIAAGVAVVILICVLFACRYCHLKRQSLNETFYEDEEEGKKLQTDNDDCEIGRVMTKVDSTEDLTDEKVPLQQNGINNNTSLRKKPHAPPPPTPSPTEPPPPVPDKYSYAQVTPKSEREKPKSAKPVPPPKPLLSFKPKPDPPPKPKNPPVPPKPKLKPDQYPPPKPKRSEENEYT